MSISVNPPPQQNLPAKLVNDPELRPYFLYQQEYLFKLWQRTGGGTDNIGSQQDQIDAIKLRLDAIEGRLDAVEARLTYLEGTMVVTAVSVTATGNTTIICTDALTVTFDASPLDKDLVKVKARNGNVTIDGNGKNIDGNDSVIIRRNFTGLDMVYSSELDAWSIV